MHKHTHGASVFTFNKDIIAEIPLISSTKGIFQCFLYVIHLYKHSSDTELLLTSSKKRLTDEWQLLHKHINVTYP